MSHRNERKENPMKKTARPVFILMWLLMAVATGYSQRQRVVSRQSPDEARRVQDAYSRSNPTAGSPTNAERAIKPARLQTDAGQPMPVDNYQKSVDDASKSSETHVLAETQASPTLEGVHDSQKSAPLNLWLYHSHLSFLLPRPARLAVRSNDERTPLTTDSQSGNWPQIKIRSIAKGGDRKIAMINDKVVGVGDEINGVIVTEINDYNVKMKKGMETKEFQVGK